MTVDMQATPKPHTPHRVDNYGSYGPGNEEEVQFENVAEEAAFYRDKYRHVADLLEETRNELDEFQTSSRELEEELEKELAATERQQAELKDKIAKLEVEKEEWKTKHVSLQKTHSSTTAAMQREMDNLRTERDKALVALRDLEVGNDELERHGRVAASSLLDMESKLNRAIEDKTLLEQELIMKGELEDQIQRLKTELRDSGDQVSILRDQLARATLPTPPSSISAPLSPSQASSHLPDPEVASMTSARSPLGVESPLPPPVPPKGFLPPLPLSSSTTSSRHSSLQLSPTSTLRFSIQSQPTQMPSPTLSRTASSRVPSVAGSPGLRRSATTTGLNSPARTASALGNGHPSHRPSVEEGNKGKQRSAMARIKDIRSRLGKTDERLGAFAGGKRTTSGSSKAGGAQADSRQVSNASFASSTSAASSTAVGSSMGAGMHSRVAELAKDSRAGASGFRTPEAPAGVLSPTGWVLADGDAAAEFESADDTPLAYRPGSSAFRSIDPSSPLVSLRPTSRATSNTSTSAAASVRSSRLGTGASARSAVPSPLMSMAAETAARDRERGMADKSRPPVSSALSRANVLTASRLAEAADSRTSGRIRSVTGSTAGASEVSASASTRPPSRTSTVLSKSTSRAPSRSGAHSVLSASFDEYTSDGPSGDEGNHARRRAGRGAHAAPPVSGQAALSRSVRASSRTGARTPTNIPRPSSRMSTGLSRPTSPIANGQGASSATGLPAPSASRSSHGYSQNRSAGLTRSTTMTFASVSEALSAPKGSSLRAHPDVARPDSRPTSRARAAAGGGSTSRVVSSTGDPAGRERRVSHGRTQSSVSALGHSTTASMSAHAPRSALTSSTSTRRLADRHTVASANRTNTDALRRSVRRPTGQGEGEGAIDEGDDYDEGEGEGDRTLTGIPSLSRLNSSVSRTPRSSPGAGLSSSQKGRPVSLQHFGFGTPPETPKVPDHFRAARRRTEVPEA